MVTLRPRVSADKGDVSEAGQLQEELDALSPELRHYVQEENWRLEREAEEWDEEQSCRLPPAEPSPASGPQELSSESGPGNAASEFANRRETDNDQLVENTPKGEKMPGRWSLAEVCVCLGEAVGGAARALREAPSWQTKGCSAVCASASAQACHQKCRLPLI